MLVLAKKRWSSSMHQERVRSSWFEARPLMHGCRQAEVIINFYLGFEVISCPLNQGSLVHFLFGRHLVMCSKYSDFSDPRCPVFDFENCIDKNIWSTCPVLYYERRVPCVRQTCQELQVT